MEHLAFGVSIIIIIMLLCLITRNYVKVLSSNWDDGSTSMTKIKWEEKRKDVRVEVKWPVTMETAGGSLNGETKNVSIGGAFICCQKPLSLKETFRLSMNPTNHQPVTVTAEVLWSNSNVPESEIVNRGMGVRFLGISNEDRQFISEVLADHQ